MALPNMGFQQDDSLRKKAIERRLKNKRPAQNVESPVQAQIKLDQESDLTVQRKKLGY